MKELIKISEQNGKQAVSARELHAFLGSKQDFSNWIKSRIKKYGFVESQDFQRFNSFIETGGRAIEYALSIDCAKELAMVEGNDKGKQARQYFIECEKYLRGKNKQLSQIEIIAQSAQILLEQSKQIDEIKHEIQQIKVQTMTRPNYFTVVGYASLNGISCGIRVASTMGRQASNLCKKRGICTESIPDPRFGEVKTYPYDILEEVFNLSITV